MKTEFTFDVGGINSLAKVLENGLIGYATNIKNIGGMTAFWCFLCDGSVLNIQSTMNDLSGWEEVGTLVFRQVTKDEKLPQMINLPSAWTNIILLEKIVLHDDEFIAESGLLMKNALGEELTIICGANVYSIQVRAPFFSGEFFPEYDIDSYDRAPV